jgi:hypothetical protein
MARGRGTPNYNSEALIAIVRSKLPSGSKEWMDVCAQYQKVTEPRRREKTLDRKAM